MSMLEQARLIIYRIKEKGLEIFLVNSGSTWDLPEISKASPKAQSSRDFIELDPVKTQEQGPVSQALAVEGDWHDSPSLKNLLHQDVEQLKDQIDKISPEMEKGAFFAITEALHKIGPVHDAFIRELKDIIRDRNSIRNL
jgi:hypothetical protein